MNPQIDAFFHEPGWDGPFFKKLAANDTKDTKAHQVGPNIPKDIQKFFPPLPTPLIPLWVQVDPFIDFQKHPSQWASYKWYKSKGENRVTNIGSWYLQNAHKSHYLVIQRHSEFRLYFRMTLVTGNSAFWNYLEDSTQHLEKTQKLKTGGIQTFRWGPLSYDHPPTVFSEPTLPKKAPFPASTNISSPDWDESDHSEEGRVVLRLHKVRERDRTLVKRKKSQAQSLTCEVCNFDFNQAYGEDYIECHHRVPLSDLDVPAKTGLDDLALVCANCHRMLHRGTDHLEIQALKDRLRVTYAYND